MQKEIMHELKKAKKHGYVCPSCGYEKNGIGVTKNPLTQRYVCPKCGLDVNFQTLQNMADMHTGEGTNAGEPEKEMVLPVQDDFIITDIQNKNSDIENSSMEQPVIPQNVVFQQANALLSVPLLLDTLQKEKNATKISTGFLSLDTAFGGGITKQLYVLGGRSSVGKTTFLLQVANAVARQHSYVLFFTLEQSKNSQIIKTLSYESYINQRFIGQAKTYTDIRNGNISGKDMDCLIQCYQQYAPYLYYFDEMHTASAIRTKVRQFIKETNCVPVVFIDYLQKIRPVQNALSDKQIIDDSVNVLVSLSTEAPVFVISSLNRQSYHGKIEQSSFKESGSIEYSADVLIGMQSEKNADTVEVSILKNRFGCRASLRFEFISAYSYFAEISS